MEFHAELKEVRAIKTASLDRECKIVLITNETQVMELGKDEPDTIYVITIRKELTR